MKGEGDGLRNKIFANAFEGSTSSHFTELCKHTKSTYRRRDVFNIISDSEFLNFWK